MSFDNSETSGVSTRLVLNSPIDLWYHFETTPLFALVRQIAGYLSLLISAVEMRALGYNQW
jgi:hypothetical protein